MLQSSNPCSKVFSEIAIDLKGNSTSLICNANKTLAGVVIDGTKQYGQGYEIIIFSLKENKWVEKLRVKLESISDVRLLCFHNNDSQLLFYKCWTDSIEFVNVKQNNILGIFKHLSGTIKCFYKFETKICQQVQINLSKESKMILIQTEYQILLFDVTKHQILQKFDRKQYNFQDRYLGFLDENYIISLPKTNEGSLNIYNIQKTKVQKMLNQKFQKDSLIYQINDCKSLAFSSKGSSDEFNKRNWAAILNLINLKLVRKLIIKQNESQSSRILGNTQKYQLFVLHSNDRISLATIDLQNFNFEISKLRSGCVYRYENDILSILEYQSWKTQLWIVNEFILQKFIEGIICLNYYSIQLINSKLQI